jgi:tRNA (mo5U34)-methyltransferase
MRDEEIQQKIATFPGWHYYFDLKGNPTGHSEGKAAIRHQWRKEYFFDPLMELFGGSLEGMRVLDLGCNQGFWSLCAIEAGCDYVLGIDGRQRHIEQATFVFEVKEIKKDRYDFIASNLFTVEFSRFGNFDVVLCPGLMYHISKHMELIEKISEVNSDVLLIDTTLATISGSCLRIRQEPTENPGAAVDYELVMTPTQEAVRDLVQQFGYSVRLLKPHFEAPNGVKNWVDDYRREPPKRRAFICAKQTDLSRLVAETEPIERSSPKQGPRWWKK